MIVAVSRREAPNVQPKVATITGDHKAETVAGAVFSRLGWQPVKVTPGRDGMFWAYHAKAV